MLLEHLGAHPTDRGALRDLTTQFGPDDTTALIGAMTRLCSAAPIRSDDQADALLRSGRSPEVVIESLVQCQGFDPSPEVVAQAFEQRTELLVVGFSGDADVVEQVLFPAGGTQSEINTPDSFRLTGYRGHDVLVRQVFRFDQRFLNLFS